MTVTLMDMMVGDEGMFSWVNGDNNQQWGLLNDLFWLIVAEIG